VALLTASLRAALVMLAIVVSSAAKPALAQGSIEYDIKAAFLYNFTKFIEWPALPAGSEPFRICVIGDPAFAQAVDRIIDGEAVQGHPLQRLDPQTPQEARDCGILYVGAAETDRGMRIAAAVRQAPVLVVGEGPRFVSQGGAIAFVLENNRVRFDVNTAATSRAGLKVSSKLLRVARNVTESGGLR
jgi:hypothetical protein